LNRRADSRIQHKRGGFCVKLEPPFLNSDDISQPDMNENSVSSQRTDQAAPSAKAPRAFAAFMAIYAAILLASLGSFPFLGPDEPRYAQVAREMFAGNDWISTRLSGLLWFEKPILFYWLAAASYHFFGVGEFAARLPSALAALATIGFVFFALRRLQLPQLGWISAIVLATSAMWIGMSHAATIDMLLSASFAVAVLSAFLATQNEGKTSFHFWLLCAAATGLAMLAKGLVGVLLLFVILAIYSVVMRRAAFPKGKSLVAAVVVFLLVIGLWYLPVTLRHGMAFIDEFFINHHFKRFLTNKYQHPEPLYFFPLVAFIGVLPWSFFLLPALARLRSLRPRENSSDALTVFLWIWALVPIAFFSVSSSKLADYILPSFPALAILAAAQAERLWNGEKSRLLSVAALLNALSLAALALGGARYFEKKGIAAPGEIALLIGTALALTLVVAVSLAKGKMRAAALCPAPAALLVLTGLAFFVLPHIGSVMGDKTFAVNVASALRPREEIIFYRLKRKYAHVFYSAGRVHYYHGGKPIQGMSTGDDLDLESRDELVSALRYQKSQNRASVVLISLKKWQGDFAGDARFSSQKLAEAKDSVAYRVSLKPKSTPE